MFSIIMSLFTKRTKATSNMWFAPKRGKTNGSQFSNHVSTPLIHTSKRRVVEHWNSDGGTVWWNSGTVIVEQSWWTSVVEQCNSKGGTAWWNSGTVVATKCGGTVQS